MIIRPSPIKLMVMNNDWEAILGTNGSSIDDAYDGAVSGEMYRGRPKLDPEPRSLPFEKRILPFDEQ